MSAAILKKWVCSSFSCCAKLVVASSSTYKVFWTFKKTLPSSAYLCVKNKKNVGKSYVYIYLHLSRSKVHRTQWGDFYFDVSFKSPVVVITLTKVFDRTIPSKILFSFPWNLYLETDGTSLPILFLVKNFEEKKK